MSKIYSSIEKALIQKDKSKLNKILKTLDPKKILDLSSKLGKSRRIARGFPGFSGMRRSARGFPGFPGMKRSARGFPGFPGMKRSARGFPGFPGMKRSARGFPGFPGKRDDSYAKYMGGSGGSYPGASGSYPGASGSYPGAGGTGSGGTGGGQQQRRGVAENEDIYDEDKRGMNSDSLDDTEAYAGEKEDQSRMVSARRELADFVKKFSDNVPDPIVSSKEVFSLIHAGNVEFCLFRKCLYIFHLKSADFLPRAPTRACR